MGSERANAAKMSDASNPENDNESSMKSENRILKIETPNCVSPIFVVQPKRQKLRARFRAQAQDETKRQRQRKAVLNVLRSWSAGELSRNTPELE